MEFNNKTILISGLIIASFIAMYLNYEQIALAIVSGLVGYLSKDATMPNNSVNDNLEVSAEDTNSVNDNLEVSSTDEVVSVDEDNEECC